MKNPKLFMLRTDIVETCEGIYGVVTNRAGFQFAVTYAIGTSVTREKIAKDWYDNRGYFKPYDWCSMSYCENAKAMHDL